ncbi:DUF1073 domain-containing protein [Nostoc sp. CHAB 5836]|uniref:anti-CBASS protein Acb1 family protein n=1 Tax=Nostoc sp. CHAB 5836 TaxID=2780404 RepID=UPI001E3AF8F2|nr:anti-CBASS Acb1 family protein [Nostoc sp. CHAB 5836]MCC5616531.1 DUF1073 domain-containing protein [Nostoc sp. CHAB 5836]
MSENPFVAQVEADDKIRLDATLMNVLTQMGTGGDKSEYTTIGRSKRIPKEQLEDLYRVPICRRIVRARPDSAVLKGWNLTLGNGSDQKIIGKFNKYHDRLKIKEKFNQAQIQANIYGGSVIVIIADDGKNSSEPLEVSKIKSITSLEVLDRYKIAPDLQLGINASEPEYYRLLLPEFLQGKFNQLFPSEKGRNFNIHSSRIIRFDGVAYTPDMLWDNEGWGGSILENLWEDYRDWKTALKAIGAMVQDCSLFVYKLKGLAAMLKAQDENLLKARLHLMRMMISVFGGFAADAEGESIEFPSRSFAGVGEVATQLRDSFIGSAGIPHDRLFGESPSGLGATGESEEKNWSHDVASFQQTEWLPKLKIIGSYIFLAKDGPSKGIEPEDWGFEFPSLLQQSEADIASNRSTQASTDNTYLSTGVLLPEEVRASRFGGSKYSIETVLDEKLFFKKQKEAEAQQQQQFGDFGGEEELLSEEELPSEEVTNEDSAERFDALYSQLPKDSEGRVRYLGKWWHTNKPVKSDRTGKKRMVLAKKGDRVKLVHYGAEGYQHNYSESAKRNYLTRSAGIKDKNGNPTYDDPFSPNHWARKDLWNKKLPADGSTLYQGRGEKEYRSWEENGKGKKCGDGYTSAKNKCRTDAANPAKRIVTWNGLSIGITHEPGDTRFPLSRPMESSYGHLRRSYGKASDGKSIDVYLGDRLESPQAYKVRQLDPVTGMVDEDKYFIGFEDAGSARDCFTYHAGRDRFGGIEPINQSELQVYSEKCGLGVSPSRAIFKERQDNCGDGATRLSSGVQTFERKLFTNGAPTSSEILEIVQSTFPEEILKLGDWKYKEDGTADGEFYTPLGVYGFGIKNNYCGYAWRRELRVDSDPVRSGYTWVNDRRKKKDQLEVPRLDSGEEDIVDLIVKQYTKKLPIQDWVRAIGRNLQNFKTLEDLRDRTPELYDKLNPSTFTQVIEQCRILSHLAGMADIEDEVKSQEEEGSRDDAKAPPWLNQKFSEAIAYFRRKIVIPTQRWGEFTAQNHDFAFTVSGLTRADLLEDVRWLVDQAISEGNDIETFTSQFGRLIGRKGWKPSDKRIYTILDTNSRRAYAAGRYEQATTPEMLERRPYWIWKHRDSVIPRPNHLALDNKAIAANHPFWKIATPSCAWGCRCSFFSANERMLQRIGARILTNPPDPKTIADPSFQRAPGLAPDEDREDVLQQGLQRFSPDIAQKVRVIDS